MKFGKAAFFSFMVSRILELIQMLQLPLMRDLTRRNLFSFFLGTTFDPCNFIFYGIGTALGLLFLWLMEISEWQNYTEVC
jgi:hypothetical protein